MNMMSKTKRSGMWCRSKLLVVLLVMLAANLMMMVQAVGMGKEGAVCKSDAECDSGNFYVCGTSGKCERKLDIPCDDNDDCIKGLVCRSDPGAFDRCRKPLTEEERNPGGGRGKSGYPWILTRLLNALERVKSGSRRGVY